MDKRARQTGDGVQMATRHRKATHLMASGRESMMMRCGNLTRATAVALTALVIAGTASTAEAKKQTSSGMEHGADVARKSHRLVLQVNANDPAMMNLALNNATNVAQYYHDIGETVKIDIVAYGPGLHMLRQDTSPVKDRIKAIAGSTPSIAFSACGNTRENMTRIESKEIPLISEATVVKSGVVHVMELEEQGWTYVKP
jgi:uncharacterized protein